MTEDSAPYPNGFAQFLERPSTSSIPKHCPPVEANRHLTLQEQRATYDTLKSWALASYYDGCRDCGVTQGWPHEQIMGYVSYTFEDGFENPTEDLMWQVILLILSGGWHKEWEINARKSISDQINSRSLDTLLAGVPKNEADMFRHDLKILELI